MTGECANKVMALCKANFPLYAGGINTTHTTGLWLRTFQNTPDDLMETAINLCLLSCKSFPTVADIRQAIDELRRESKTEPVLQKLPSRSRWTSPAAQAAFTTVKSNKANEHMQGLEITDLLKFAKGIFSEISESTVRKYLPEFMLAQESADMCNRCMWDKKQCVNNGFKATLRISKFGIVDNVMIPCAKNRAV